MSEARRRDPLLATARIGLTISKAILVFGIAVTLAGVLALIVVPPARFGGEWAGAPSVARYGMTAAAFLCAVILYLALRFVSEFRRIVLTVAEGDPFVPANAARLTKMGWTALAVQAAGLILASLVLWGSAWFEQLRPKADYSFGWLVLALTLFILARVFRHGAAMREDLEGTV